MDNTGNALKYVPLFTNIQCKFRQIVYPSEIYLPPFEIYTLKIGKETLLAGNHIILDMMKGCGVTGKDIVYMTLAVRFYIVMPCCNGLFHLIPEPHIKGHGILQG